MGWAWTMKINVLRLSCIYYFLLIMLLSAPSHSLAQEARTEVKQTAVLFNFLSDSQEDRSLIWFVRSLPTEKSAFNGIRGLDALFSQTRWLNKEYAQHQTLSYLWAAASALEVRKDLVSKPDATIAKSDGEIVVNEDHRSPVLAPYKYKNTHYTLISISWPFAATDRLTITPLFSYAFSMNNSERYDFKDRAIVRPIDNEGAIIYSGIHLSYVF